MRVLIFHGYLLQGTGSNVYTASLARALAGLGHEVHLLCQDRNAAGLEWPGPGSVTVHNPEIGGLLPVFVRDTYEGFEVKEFPELTDDELERYIELNAAAVREVVDRHGAPDAVLANHLVMGAVAVARAGLRYALKVHGSDLSYTVLPNLARFRPYAEEAVAGANGILVGSTHIAERLRQAVDDPTTNAKVRLGPPGVDTDLFTPIDADGRTPRLRALAKTLHQRVARHGGPPDIARRPPAEDVSGGNAVTGPAAGDAWSRDLPEAASAIEWFAASEGPRVVFIGKLIVSKGVDLLLAAWPLVRAAEPEARLLIAGFGAYRETLGRLWGALEGADLDEAREIAAHGRGLEGGEAKPLPILAGFLANPPAGYAAACSATAGSVRFAGRLTHDEVGELVPASDALVFPSTFPEAFGMVAAEAASAGVLPVSAGHSGALEVSRALAADLPAAIAPLVSFPVDERAVEAIAERLRAWLALDEAGREPARRSLRETAVRRWSWQGVVRDVLAASASE